MLHLFFQSCNLVRADGSGTKVFVLGLTCHQLLFIEVMLKSIHGYVCTHKDIFKYFPFPYVQRFSLLKLD